MGRQLPLECSICYGIIDWGDFGPSGGDPEYAKEDKPTCTCVRWVLKDNHWTFGWRIR